MNFTEKYYHRWIKDISKTTSKKEIRRHLRHHINELDSPFKNPENWLASMYNLLHIYENVHNVKSDTHRQLYKLGTKYYKNEGWTPPPGRKIPKNVLLKATSWVDTSNDPMVTVSELRGLGRGKSYPRWHTLDHKNKKTIVHRKTDCACCK